jgi:hypothetical protein
MDGVWSLPFVCMLIAFANLRKHFSLGYQEPNCFWRKRSFSANVLCTAVPSGRVARFFLAQHAKFGKIYQMTTKYTKPPQNIPNDQKYTK